MALPFSILNSMVYAWCHLHLSSSISSDILIIISESLEDLLKTRCGGMHFASCLSKLI